MKIQNLQIMPALIEDVTYNVRRVLGQLFENRFDGNFEVLSSQGIEALTGTLHAGLLEAGRLAIQQYIQAFEEDRPSLEVNGVQWYRSERSEKSFLTKFGEIVITRGLYYRRDEEGRRDKQTALVPLDSAWGMQDRYATVDIVEALLCASASMTPRETAGFFAKVAGITPSTSLIYNVIQNDGVRLKEFVDNHAEERWAQAEIPEDAEVVVASFDGANVCLRERGPKRGRRAERPQKDDPNKTENGSEASAYRNVMVGAISAYKARKVTDTSGEITWKPQRLQSHYLAEMPEQGFGTFREQSIAAIKQLQNQFPREGVIKLLINDGARNLWNWARNETCFEDFDWLLDLYHASEHLSVAAENLFGKQSVEAKSWYDKWRKKLKSEEWAVDGLIKSIAYHIKARKLNGTRKTSSKRERQFFINNRDQMNYAIYVEAGYPIGSGPVEAACKTIVKERMCRSGMRWNRTSGGNILNLRVLTKSNQWDAMWGLYRDQCWEKQAA
jgi:hypothetical protein